MLQRKAKSVEKHWQYKSKYFFEANRNTIWSLKINNCERTVVHICKHISPSSQMLMLKSLEPLVHHWMCSVLMPTKIMSLSLGSNPLSMEGTPSLDISLTGQ